MNIKKPKKPGKPKRGKKPAHYATAFDLDVLSGDDDMFRWFLLTFLLGKPIQSSVAVRTWKLFIDKKLDLPWAILQMTDRQLVSLLHEGGYTRYQHVMTKALKNCLQQLVDQYEGSLYLLLDNSENEDELSQRLQEFYGVGPKTAEIFMLETEEYFARRNE
ncbi:MAG TPA: DNA methylase [Patescibacteria group bacterium]|nr:DNA methylase [Patescibacteria group bacterium]